MSQIGISARGREVAASRASSTIAAIAAAKRAIEKDIEECNGLYPFANGVISTAEVLRRAGLSPAALQKPVHRNLRGEVTSWVSETRQKLARGAKVIRKAVTDRVDTARRETQQLRQTWIEAELEYIELRQENVELQKRCADLEQQVAELKAALAGDNIRPMDKSKRPSK